MRGEKETKWHQNGDIFELKPSLWPIRAWFNDSAVKPSVIDDSVNKSIQPYISSACVFSKT